MLKKPFIEQLVLCSTSLGGSYQKYFICDSMFRNIDTYPAEK